MRFGLMNAILERDRELLGLNTFLLNQKLSIKSMYVCIYIYVYNLYNIYNYRLLGMSRELTSATSSVTFKIFNLYKNTIKIDCVKKRNSGCWHGRSILPPFKRFGVLNAFVPGFVKENIQFP